ncbi:MAG: metallophosphoesterase [Deltaproteobacteria bacterium]
MALFAISDMHLSIGNDKPMDIFSDKWQGHTEKLKENWLKTVTEADTVIIPGDVCWATYINDAFEDFKYIASLPGKKIISKGNHDYWWETMSKMNRFLTENSLENIFFLHNNFFEYEDWVICGTRGWPSVEETKGECDKKMFARELSRLENSLNSAINTGKEKIITALHFPPFYSSENGFIEVMKKYRVSICLYGHLHGDFSSARQGLIEGIDFKFVSADYLNFMPERIL